MIGSTINLREEDIFSWLERVEDAGYVICYVDNGIDILLAEVDLHPILMFPKDKTSQAIKFISKLDVRCLFSGELSILEDLCREQAIGVGA